MKLFTALALVATAFLGVLLAGPKAGLTARDMGGKRVHLRDYHGKIVVLNFWATWCGPCREELPMLVASASEYAGRGVQFIAVSLDDSKGMRHVPEFVTRYHIDFPVLVGATADDLDRLKMGPAVPATAFFDQEGHIVARVSGEIRKTELQQRIDWLLGDRKSPAPEPFVSHLDH